MTTLAHRVPIAAPASTVFAAVATEAGMRGWWTADTVMTPEAGGKAEFGFDRRGALFSMTVEAIDPDRSITLRVDGGQPEWEGTVLSFVVEPTPEGAVLRFEHRGWRDVTDFCASCNSMWGNLMFRLKGFAETGRPQPQWTE